MVFLSQVGSWLGNVVTQILILAVGGSIAFNWSGIWGWCKDHIPAFGLIAFVDIPIPFDSQMITYVYVGRKLKMDEKKRGFSSIRAAEVNCPDGYQRWLFHQGPRQWSRKALIATVIVNAHANENIGVTRRCHFYGNSDPRYRDFFNAGTFLHQKSGGEV